MKNSPFYHGRFNCLQVFLSRNNLLNYVIFSVYKNGLESSFDCYRTVCLVICLKLDVNITFHACL